MIKTHSEATTDVIFYKYARMTSGLLLYIINNYIVVL
jgi:hypothetical protein